MCKCISAHDLRRWVAMKFFFQSTKWKTDPRAAYIPPALFTIFFAVIYLASAPAWSFEAVHGHIDNAQVTQSSQNKSASYNRSDRTFRSSSSAQVDSCLPLLSSSHPYHLDRNQRSAGKAAALGRVFGVRFALTPPKTARSSGSVKPRLDVWQPQPTSTGNRSALAVTAYRECQKRQALNALNGFRWKR